MGVRGELFSTKVALKNRTYFFNVKENRLGDVFMTVVESKPSEGEGFDRHQIVLFADDLRDFLQGFESSLKFIEKEVGSRSRAKREARLKPADRPRAEGNRPDGPRGSDRPAGAKKVLRRKEGSKPAGNREAFAKRTSSGPRPQGAKRPKVKSVRKPERD